MKYLRKKGGSYEGLAKGQRGIFGWTPLIILMVSTPLVMGIFVYVVAEVGYVIGPVRNYLPDFLWAMSLGLVLLWIWSGRINWFWWVATILMACMFEFGQEIGWIPGTADSIDILMYLLGLFSGRMIWLLVNPGIYLVNEIESNE
ncbi:MAG: hypothetical protein ACK4E0_13745 [Chitinophagaceae bacterium]